MLSQSDEDLVEALGRGDENALRTLVDRHTPAIYRFSLRYTGDESLAQDICQEVFLKVYRYSHRYKQGMPFKTWLFAIVRNTSIDLARPYTYRKTHSLDTADETDSLQAAGQPLSREIHTPEEDYSFKETAQRLESALGALPEKRELRQSSSIMRKCPLRKLPRSWRRPSLRWNRCSCGPNATL